ncbi:MAG TPA: YicC family protein [Fulvivirga sp.]|nr:YicC family protein [Fulvivirga sp.]
MLKSMTGYGAAKLTNGSLTINVEVKTLNSKFLDLNLRTPKSISENELTLRTLVSDILERGKVSLSVDVQNESETELKQKFNEALFVKYYKEMEKLAQKVGANESEIFRMALASPDVIVNTNSEETAKSNWEDILILIKQALEQCDQFRIKEGKVLHQKFEGYIKAIGNYLKEVEVIDPQRVEKVRNRIYGNLKQFVEEEGLDQNRLEQEMVYYIEKFDITEEKVRLRNHLDHFAEVLDEDQSLGKKLGFISQEIGREINTIGSKANDSQMQKQVVSMKEELEKIKEQLLNVL